MSTDLGALIPELQPFAHQLVDLGGRAGVQPRVTSTVRSHSQQQRLYNSFLRGESKYPVAPPGKSAHEYGYAFDMVADSTENLHDLGSVWVSWGGKWSPADEVHFEYPGFNPAAVVDPLVSPCEFFDPSTWSVSPECACKLVDTFGTKWWLGLLELGWPENELIKLASEPCSTLVQLAAKHGL